MDIYSNNYDHNNNQYSKYAQVSTFATSSEPPGNPSTRLPPKMLHKRSKLRNFFVHLAIALAACAMFAIAVMYGVTGYYFAINQKSDNTDNSCDKQAASTTEQRFVIDIRLGGSFSLPMRSSLMSLGICSWAREGDSCMRGCYISISCRIHWSGPWNARQSHTVTLPVCLSRRCLYRHFGR